MNSLFAKILLWFWCTLAITVVGAALISALGVNETNTDRRALIGRLVTSSWSRPAPPTRPAAARHSRPSWRTCAGSTTPAASSPTKTAATCSTGQDRAALLRVARASVRASSSVSASSPWATPWLARAADDGRYWFFLIVPRAPLGSWFLTPEHLFMLFAAALLCYWLAFHLTRPVVALQKAVERFGRGDLAARVGSAPPR